ncbi:unnamed protein product, partial [Symbiodinium pilosum]
VRKKLTLQTKQHAAGQKDDLNTRMEFVKKETASEEMWKTRLLQLMMAGLYATLSMSFLR